MKTSTSSLATLLVFALVASATPVIEESRHQQELREHFHHLSYIAEYSCHHPQPRTVPVHELLSPYQTRGKAFFPEYTVLHRCDVFAGCCEGAKKCGPVHADNVHLPFKVTYLEDMGDKQKGMWEMEYASFDNHTVCGCIDYNGSYNPEGKDHHKHEYHDYNDHHEHENNYHKDRHEHEDHDHNDHHEHEDHDHNDHHEHEDNDHNKDHHEHDDHDHKNHHEHEDHDHKDHYAREDYDHKYSHVVFKDKYPPLEKEPVLKNKFGSDEESYPSKSEKRPEPNSNNKNIDSLYILI